MKVLTFESDIIMLNERLICSGHLPQISLKNIVYFPRYSNLKVHKNQADAAIFMKIVTSPDHLQLRNLCFSLKLVAKYFEKVCINSNQFCVNLIFALYTSIIKYE